MRALNSPLLNFKRVTFLWSLLMLPLRLATGILPAASFLSVSCKLMPESQVRLFLHIASTMQAKSAG